MDKDECKIKRHQLKHIHTRVHRHTRVHTVVVGVGDGRSGKTQYWILKTRKEVERKVRAQVIQVIQSSAVGFLPHGAPTMGWQKDL